MKELIKISEREGKQVVSARELYIQLGYDISSFSKWATRNIIDNEFAIEGEDWTIVLNSDIDNQWINNPTKAPKDYAITVNMAKKLAMMSKTEMGNKIRDYFLECEKKAISGITLPNFNNPAEAARAWALVYEAKQIADLGKELIPLINEDLKNLMGQLGIEFGSGVKDAALSSLQKGISSVTEETAGAIEAYLNMVSGQVFQQTTILQGIWDMTNVNAGTMSQMLLQMRSSYQILQAIQVWTVNISTAAGNGVNVRILPD